MAVAAFDYAGWAARYPEFGTIGPILAGEYFAEAGLYLNNTDGSVVRDVNVRRTLLYMITAHIAQLNAPKNGVAASDLVGRVNSASEGSVSVGAEYQVPGSAAWFAQTKYGAAYWQATAQYRTMRYVAGVQPRFNPPFWP